MEFRPAWYETTSVDQRKYSRRVLLEYLRLRKYFFGGNGINSVLVLLISSRIMREGILWLPFMFLGQAPGL